MKKVMLLVLIVLLFVTTLITVINNHQDYLLVPSGNLLQQLTQPVYSSVYLNWGIERVNAPDAWQRGLTGKGVKIAVIDTGVGPHAQLPVAGGVVINYDHAIDKPPWYDSQGHGTAVAGVIAGRCANLAHIGIAPDALIYSVKVGDSENIDTWSIIQGINWAVENHMDIIQLSIAIPVPESESRMADYERRLLPLKAAVDKAYDSGVLIVCSAGNDGMNEKMLQADANRDLVSWPARFNRSVIAVGATQSISSNQIAYYSNRGSEVEVVAPGCNILTLSAADNDFKTASGTSISAAYVTGVLALYKQAYPNLGNRDLRKLLDDNTIDLGPKGRDPLYGFGLIQAPPNPEQQTMYSSSMQYPNAIVSSLKK